MKENAYSQMDESAYRVAYLVAGYIRQALTEKERDELDDWINASDSNMLLFEELTEPTNLQANLEWMDKVQSEHSYQHVREAGAFATPGRVAKVKGAWIAAAAILILIVGGYFIFRNASKGTANINEMAKIKTPPLQPGGNRAILTLANGSVIDLAAAKNGLIKNDNGSDIIKLADGTIYYEPDGTAGEAPAVHTLSTPAGGQYQVKLPDGTLVWLNAATTLKYPAHFETHERRVELHGEAYFEVAKNEKQPFRVVLADSASITVLGTHFNVMAYPNEQAKEITLMEGKVTVNKGSITSTLEPGMQASIKGADISTTTGADTEEIMGWKNGLFVFHDAPIGAIMRQVERWYDAKVVYQGEVNHQFNATIKRSEPLAKLLHLLELTEDVHFKIKNNTIYVLP